MADIFISYKSERRPAARHLKKVLECYFSTTGEDCVWYDYGLVPGHDFEPRIMAEIAAAKVVLVLWCGLAVKSDWVLKEAREARRVDKFLPIRIDTCVLPDGFAGADTVSLAEWDASPRSPMLDRLLDDIGRRLGREANARVSRLRELEEDWRGYGAPSLAHFALGKPLEPGASKAVQPVPAAVLGAPPPGIPDNLAALWANAQNGDLAALVDIGWHYSGGYGGLQKDQPEAVRLFKAAVDRGNAIGQHALAMMWANGFGGLQKDDAEAERLFRLSAEQGYARGQAALGTMYKNGRGGLLKDEREAVRLYQLSADQGDSHGLYNLGAMYEAGLGGLAKDEQQAIRLYISAARGGAAWAQIELQKRDLKW